MTPPAVRDYRVDQTEHILRRGRLTRAEDIAAELQVTKRTVYRYIAALKRRGFKALSGAGAGYLFVGDRP